MKRIEIVLARQFSYTDGNYFVDEQIRSIICNRTKQTTFTKPLQLTAADISAVNCNPFPCSKTAIEIVDFLNELRRDAHSHDLELSAYLTSKVTLRSSANNGNFRCTEAVFRLILRKKGVTVGCEDVAFRPEIARFKNTLINVYHDMIKSITTVKLTVSTKVLPHCIILTPKASAFFFHEILGHLLEYDTVHSQSSIYCEPDIGRLVSCPGINAYEDPNKLKLLGVDFGEVDDDGLLLTRRDIIKNGHIVDFVRSKRCDTIAHDTQSRMYCFCIEGNKSGVTLDAMTKLVSSAIVVKDVISGGVYSESGDYFLRCGTCYLFQDGIAIGKIDNLMMSAQVSSLKNRISQIGSDSSLFLGYCTKTGQTLLVGQEAPSIMLNDVTLWHI